jgi:hypothetical protein
METPFVAILNNNKNVPSFFFFYEIGRTGGQNRFCLGEFVLVEGGMRWERM